MPNIHNCDYTLSPDEITALHKLIDKASTQIRFISFFGFGMDPAYVSANEWIENNPNAKIVDFRFTAHPHGHAICIMYEETI